MSGRQRERRIRELRDRRAEARSPLAARLLVVLSPIAIALSLAAAALADPETIRAVGHRLAPDRSFLLLEGDLSGFQSRALLFSILWIVLAALVAAPRLGLADLLASAPVRLMHASADGLRRLRRFAREERWHALGLFALTAAAALFIGAALGQPMRCDESYSALFLIPRSFASILLTYTTANNHLLNTLLAHASTELFGWKPWAIRLPVFLAGVLSVPAAYVAARLLFCRSAALLGAGAVGTSLYLVDLASNARGYPFIILVFLLLLAIGQRLLAGGGRHLWLAFVLVAALGFVAVPTMTYPLSIVLLWLLVAGRRSERVHGGRFTAALFAAGAATLVLAFLAYSPTLLAHGDRFALNLEEVRPRWSFSLPWERLGSVLAMGWTDWMYGFPRWVALLLPLMLLGLFVHRPFREVALPLLPSAGIGPLAVCFVLGTVPFSRVFSYYLPLYLLLAAAGLVGFLRAWAPARPRLAGVACGGLLAVLVGWNGAQVVEHRRAPWRVPWFLGYTDAPEAAAYLVRSLEPGERVAALRDQRPPLHFYCRTLGLAGFQAFDPREWAPPVHDVPANEPERGGDVYLIESFRFDTSAVRAALEREGYQRTDDEVLLPLSRIVRYVPGEPGPP